MTNSGINFDTLLAKGIDHSTFAEYFTTSNLIYNPNVHWYGFHTDHDFAYLLHTFSGASLPEDDKQFLLDLKTVIPSYYDIKVIAD